MDKPHVNDPELQRIMDSAYRPGAKVGSGSTAAAVRFEQETGQSVGGKWHQQKAIQLMRELEKWLREHPEATNDRAAAENVLRDTFNALNGR